MRDGDNIKEKAIHPFFANNNARKNDTKRKNSEIETDKLIDDDCTNDHRSTTIINSITPQIFTRHIAPFDNNNNSSPLTWSIYKSVLVGEHLDFFKTISVLKKDISVASFDLDNTLISPKNGRKYPIDGHDWQWLLPENIIQTKLKQLKKNNYAIVIISNQKGILNHLNEELESHKDGGYSTKKKKNTTNKSHQTSLKKLHSFKQRIESISKELGYDIPLLVMAATDEDWYRKPRPGMWEYLENMIQSYFKGGNLEGNSHAPKVERSQSFFVGDAAGRPHNWKRGKQADFSDSDRKMAWNASIRFYTPEEYFLNEEKHDFQFSDDIHKDSIIMQNEDGQEQFVLKNKPSTSLTYPVMQLKGFFPQDQEIILVLGMPCSGKTSLIENYFSSKDYVYLFDQQQQRHSSIFSPNGKPTIIKQILESPFSSITQKLRNALSEKKSCVIEETFSTKKSRLAFFKFAKEFNVPVRCVYLKTPVSICKHMNIVRRIKQQETSQSSMIQPNGHFWTIPKFIFEKYSSIVDVPEEFTDNDDLWRNSSNSSENICLNQLKISIEGFFSVVHLPFVKMKSEERDTEKLWKMYLV